MIDWRGSTDTEKSAVAQEVCTGIKEFLLLLQMLKGVLQVVEEVLDAWGRFTGSWGGPMLEEPSGSYKTSWEA